MKKFISLLFTCSSALLSAQTLEWKLDGNIVTSDAKIGTNTAYDLVFETKNIERMRLTDSGNLGIGTYYPSERIDLHGNLKLDGNIVSSQWSNSQAEDFRFTYVDQTGTLKTLNSLDLFGIIYQKDCLSQMNLGHMPLWAVNDAGSIGNIYTGVNCPARVGIGTDDPRHQFHATKDAFAKQMIIGNDEVVEPSDIFIINRKGILGQNQRLFSLSDNSEFNFVSYGNNYLLKMNRGIDNIDVFRIRQNGGLDLSYCDDQGIAINVSRYVNAEFNSVASLTNDGIWYCQGVIVKHPPFWPDYVFEANYSYLDYGSLESYLKKNKHLPNLPSQDEISENGADILKLVQGLTEEVEILNLRLLEMQKELKKCSSN